MRDPLGEGVFDVVAPIQGASQSGDRRRALLAIKDALGHVCLELNQIKIDHARDKALERGRMIFTLVMTEFERFLARAPVDSWENRGKTEIAELNFSTRVRCSLEAAGIVTIESLRRAKDRDLLKIPNFGRVCLREVRAAVPSIDIDHRDLLRRYIAHVRDCEGTTYLDGERAHYGMSDQTFTDSEWAELRKLAEEG